MGDRIVTWPNALSAARLAGVPVFLWLVLGPRTATADIIAAALLGFAGISDWLDGKLARMLNQTSRLGQLLDPAADRLYIAATIIALGVRGIIPWWLFGAIAAREVCVALALLVLRQRTEYGSLQVSFVGKAATLCLMYAFPLLFLGDARRRRVRGGADHRLGLRRLGHRALLVGGAALPHADQGPGERSASFVKAVVMAGGEGTRLRPMTANQPKPLLPVVNRPIMEHVLRLLKRHGFEETVVTVQFLAALVRNYFGDGEDVGMSLRTPPRRCRSAPRAR